jgi:hypothetical protein
LARSRLVPFLLVAGGIVALAAGGAMVGLKWHRTLGYGGLGVGVLLTLIGLGIVLSGRIASVAASSRDSRFLRALGLIRGRRARAIIVATMIVGATLGTFLYGEYQLASQSGSQFGLSLNVDAANEVTYQDGSVGVTVHVTAVGGVPPYTFVAEWGDKTYQTSTTGIFTRVFGLAVPVSTALTITATSANSGIGFLSLLLPTQYPVVSGPVSTRTLTIVPGSGAVGQAANSAASTQTKVTNTFIAVVNASTPTVAFSTTSVSTASSSSITKSGASASTSSSSLGFSITVIVLDENHQPVQGAMVALDAGGQRTTDSFGKVVFADLGLGNHSIKVNSGSFEQSFPLVISSDSPHDQNMFVVV